MGPYCNFCNQRCFTHMPIATPKHILAAYGTSTIIATCPAGQQFERKKVGYCYDDISAAVELCALLVARPGMEKYLNEEGRRLVFGSLPPVVTKPGNLKDDLRAAGIPFEETR
jgi:hypothetical protein